MDKSISKGEVVAAGIDQEKELDPKDDDRGPAGEAVSVLKRVVRLESERRVGKNDDGDQKEEKTIGKCENRDRSENTDAKVVGQKRRESEEPESSSNSRSCFELVYFSKWGKRWWFCIPE